jgi:SAM-dependent methyltransferase
MPVTSAESAVKRLIPDGVKRWLKALRPRRGNPPPVGGIRFGDFAAAVPFSRWGFGRGTPIDRHFIAHFIASCSQDVRGTVLEVGDATYTRLFGGSRVLRSEVLHVVPGTPGATVIADMTIAGSLPAGEFDCIICTQTLQQIYDVGGALANMRDALKPGGVLLATVPGISQIDRKAMDRWGDYWRFTTRGFEQLLASRLDGASIAVRSYGNVLTSAAFLFGAGAEELPDDALERHDPDYELVIGARVELESSPSGQPAGSATWS